MEILVRRIEFKGHILEFFVENEFEIRVNLLSSKDPTMVDSNLVTIDSYTETIGAEMDEESGEVTITESRTDFAQRAVTKAGMWAEDCLEERKRAMLLVKELQTLLPKNAEH